MQSDRLFMFFYCFRSGKDSFGKLVALNGYRQIGDIVFCHLLNSTSGVGKSSYDGMASLDEVTGWE